MDALSGIALAAPAGLNAYIPLLGVALAQRFGWLELRQPLDILGEWWVIALIAVLLAVEMLADKIPAVDHANDVIQTFIRPAAGGILAASTSGSGTLETTVFVVIGILLAGGVHATKAVARPVVNAATGGTGAPVVSAVEDAGATAMTVLAIVMPIVALSIAGVLVAVAVWAIRRKTVCRQS